MNDRSLTPGAAKIASSHRVRTVTSADGTQIFLEQVTRGQADLVLLSGGPSRRTRWARTAALLEGSAACWLMDRRGKGDSGDQADSYSFEREYEDLAAVVDSFEGPVHVGAHSSGATCALGAALRGVEPASLVLYEPPWPLGAALSGEDQVHQMEALIEGGKRDQALELAFTEMVGMPPQVVAALRHAPMWKEWSALVHTWPREMREASMLSPDLGPFADLTIRALFLLGTLSPTHLQRSTRAIAAAMPQACVQELPGQGHGALDQAPATIAQEIEAFLAGAGR